MAHGMSEEEVKKKLYGEFAGASKEADADKGKPKSIVRTKSIPAKPLTKIFSIKSVSIAGIALLILLSIIITAVTRSKSTIEPSKATEISEIKGYLIQGKNYYKDGLFDEAVLTWKSIIAINPNHRTALRYIKRAELKKKELKIQEEKTAQRLKEMLAKREKEEKEKIHRAEIKQLLREGDACFRKGEYPQAIALYEKVLSFSPGNRHAVRNITRAEKKISSKEEEAKVIEKPQAAQEKQKKQEKAPPPAIKKGPLYTVQIVTYQARAHAERLTKGLTSKGYKKLSIKKVTTKSGRVLYEVHLGPFDNKNDAAREMKKIKKEGFKDSFIRIK